MPQYRFGCEMCERETLIWMMREERGKVWACGVCGKPMRQLPPSRLHVNVDHLDFVTEDITGEPVRIQTKTQLDKLCAENGVRRVASDEISRNKRATPSDIRKSAGVGSFKEDCEKMAQKLGKPLYVKRKAGAKGKSLEFASRL